MGCALAGLIVGRLCPTDPVVLVGDDTVDGHPGRHVYGKARHRDPVRSSHSYTAWKYGHRWVVLAVLVRLPWATRPWRCPCWWTCTAPSRTIGNGAGRTAPRPG